MFPLKSHWVHPLPQLTGKQEMCCEPWFPWTLQLTSLILTHHPASLTSWMLHVSWQTGLHPKALCNFIHPLQDSRDLREHPSDLLILKRPALAQLAEEAFSSWVGMREAPQHPSNDTLSQPLTVGLEGSLSHTAFPRSGPLHVD